MSITRQHLPGGATVAVVLSLFNFLSTHAVRAAAARHGVAGYGILILNALLKLRQAFCDPHLLEAVGRKNREGEVGQA